MTRVIIEIMYSFKDQSRETLSFHRLPEIGIRLGLGLLHSHSKHKMEFMPKFERTKI